MPTVIFDKTTRRGRGGARINVLATTRSYGPVYTAIEFSTPGYSSGDGAETLLDLKAIIDEGLALGKECQTFLDKRNTE